LSERNRRRCARIAGGQIFRFTTGIRGGARNLPVVEDRADEFVVVHMMTSTRYVVDVVDREDVRLIKIGRRIVERLERSTKRNIRRIVVGIIK